MEIEPKYMQLIHPDASALLRPKTNLNDMIVEIEPGQRQRTDRKRRATSPSRAPSQTSNSSSSSTRLDADTRQYLQLLLAGGAQGIGGHGQAALGRLPPASALLPLLAQLNGAVAKRHVALAHVIHDFSLLTTELGRHDSEIQRFVTSSDAALGNFANQQESIQASLREFPATLQAAQAGLASSDRFSTAAPPSSLRPDPPGPGADPRLQGDRALLQADDGADPRSDPALHPAKSGRC